MSYCAIRFDWLFGSDLLGGMILKLGILIKKYKIQLPTLHLLVEIVAEVFDWIYLPGSARDLRSDMICTSLNMDRFSHIRFFGM